MNEAIAKGRRAAELEARSGDGYRLVPCPVPPFHDAADRAAALGAALVFVTREITGQWPKAEAVKAAIDALLLEPTNHGHFKESPKRPS